MWLQVWTKKKIKKKQEREDWKKDKKKSFPFPGFFGSFPFCLYLLPSWIFSVGYLPFCSFFSSSVSWKASIDFSLSEFWFVRFFYFFGSFFRQRTLFFFFGFSFLVPFFSFFFSSYVLFHFLIFFSDGPFQFPFQSPGQTLLLLLSFGLTFQKTIKALKGCQRRSVVFDEDGEDYYESSDKEES